MAREEHWHDRLWLFLQSPVGRGLAALGVLLGPLDIRVLGFVWDQVPEADGTPYPHHPERVRADIPLSRLERELARQLRPGRSPRGRRAPEDSGRGGA
ncbi:hypothetical protein OOK27_49015 [Streptomyces canus]|uniref:DUF6059 family protein n=1 Tax=Streptomyces canus TaxID=58343 RepID=UPI00224CD043|nr:DUF6059 family protein [Streptomyces canus]MCX5261983.1 hypothetical protein [Streptomyces canus]